MSEDWRDEDRARAKRELRREERQIIREAQEDKQAAAVRALELRLAGVELAYRELQEAFVVSMREVTSIFDKMGDQRSGLAQGQMNELRELRIEVAKLTTVCAELREKQVETFRFARERETLPPALPKQTKLDS
jgi:hypothetical protein